MKKILSIILLSVFVSCSKTENIQQQSQEKIMVRIQSVDTDGNTDSTNVVSLNIIK